MEIVPVVLISFGNVRRDGLMFRCGVYHLHPFMCKLSCYPWVPPIIYSKTLIIVSQTGKSVRRRDALISIRAMLLVGIFSVRDRKEHRGGLLSLGSNLVDLKGARRCHIQNQSCRISVCHMPHIFLADVTPFNASI